MHNHHHDHWMEWMTIRRETSLIEHICHHGVGHPNFYSVVRLHRWSEESAEDYGEHVTPLEASSWFIHGCDGCCGRDDFPGNKMTDEKVILRLHRKIEEYLEGDFDVDRLREWCGFTIHDLNVNRRVDGRT